LAAEVTAVWTQIAKDFQSFDSHLMLECFNEPNEAGGGSTAQAQTDLNMYLEACVNAIRGTAGVNATRIIVIQPVGASPVQSGIQSMMKTSIIDDPHLLISLHTYYPTNFGLSETPYAWGSSADYTNMQNSIAKQIRVWLPTQPIVIGEWGSQGAQATGEQSRPCARLLAGRHDGGHGSRLVGQRRQRQRLLWALQPNHRCRDAPDDRQWDHDRCRERSSVSQQLGDVCQSVTGRLAGREKGVFHFAA
jgi:hypothetical protein